MGQVVEAEVWRLGGCPVKLEPSWLLEALWGTKLEVWTGPSHGGLLSERSVTCTLTGQGPGAAAAFHAEGTGANKSGKILTPTPTQMGTMHACLVT